MQASCAWRCRLREAACPKVLPQSGQGKVGGVVMGAAGWEVLATGPWPRWWVIRALEEGIKLLFSNFPAPSRHLVEGQERMTSFRKGFSTCHSAGWQLFAV